MVSFFKDVRPEDVFTPRARVVNQSMYVHRPELERELKRAIRSGYHLVIFGDSGCGKSWLYKKVFDDERVVFSCIDLNDAHTADDVDLIMLDAIDDEDWQVVEEIRTSESSVMPYDVGRKTGRSKVMRRKETQSFEKLCISLRRAAGKKKAFVVFENLEHALEKPDVVARLRSLVLSLDDVSLASSSVQILFVGVPADIKSILAQGNKYQTISNRVIEISEVSRMSRDQASHLIRQGFEVELDMVTESFEYCISQIIYLTDRIPQYLHDLCLQVAFQAEEVRNTVSPTVVVDGAHRWVNTSARQHLGFLEATLGPGRRRTDQKSRIIYAIATWEKVNFYASDIEERLRERFPVTVGQNRVQVMRVLNKLSVGDSRLLKKNDEDQTFRVATPKLRSVLRH